MADRGIREQRLADQILRHLAQILHTQARDPRLQGLTLMDVSVSRDLAWADVHYAVSDAAARQHGLETIEQILERSSGFLRSELAARLSIRKLPRLRFHRDETLERAGEIERLLDADGARSPDGAQ